MMIKSILKNINTHSGDGSGFGYGDGYGSGYGDGDGYGDGSGDSSGDAWKTIAWDTVMRWNLESKHRLQAAKNAGAFIALWKSGSDGKASNGGSMAFIATPGLSQEVSGPLKLCGRNALHATLNPSKWKGDRVWVVALYGEVLREGDKVGALKREIIGEITPWLR